jgi:2-desacetyl-2-hydroxyethyl bacteriochlorophyllide A dehydrogenase
MVRISRVGLCGTDFHIFTGNQPYLNYPRVMGHELAGQVAEADGDSGFQLGELVTINPYLPCGDCIACRKAKPNCCVNIKVMGVHIDGGMTEFVCVPERAVVKVDGLTADQAAMIEFLSIGAHAVRRATLAAGERVLVVGAGPIGIAAALFARLAGTTVWIIDTSPQRLDFAKSRLDFDRTGLVDGAISDWLDSQTQNEGFDCVFDATGNAAAIEKGFRYVAHGGRYVLLSVVKDNITFSDPEFHKREMTLIGSRNATQQDFEHVIGCVRSGAIPTDLLNTHSFNLDDMPRAVPEFLENFGSVLKAIGRL